MLINSKSTLRLAILVAAVITGAHLGAFAQTNANVSVVHLMTQPNPSGGQLVLTPRGALVPLPGAGVNGNVVDIYMGATGGYWYVDRNGTTVDLTGYVQQIRSQAAQAQTAAPPQYAPYPTSNTTSTGGSNALGTAAAAGMGAMVGASVAHYNNVPYGAPMYYNNGNPYYRDVEGKGVFVDDGEVQWNNVAKGKQAQNYKQQQNIAQAQAFQQQQQATRDGRQQDRQSQMDSNQKQRQDNRPDRNNQAQMYQQQQQWYQQQTQDRNRAQAWQQQSAGDNPFVRSQDGGRQARGESGGDREARGERGGREARGERGGGREARAERGGGGARGGGGRRGR